MLCEPSWEREGNVGRMRKNLHHDGLRERERERERENEEEEEDYEWI